MAEPRPWQDYSRSRGVLIGVSGYANLPAVPAAINSLARMRQLLTGPLCGWPAGRLDEIANPRRRGELPDDLMAAYADVTGTALFYFVGHGQLFDEELCLALTESPLAGPQRTTVGLPFGDVRRALRESPARVKIVILDCCYSGHATLPGQTLSGGGEVIDLTLGTGALTLTASGAHTTAWYETDHGNARPRTYFTKYLADTIENGIPDGPEGLALGAIYTHTAESLARDRRPAPSRSSRNDADQVPFAINAAHGELGRLRSENAALREQLKTLTQQVADLGAQVAQGRPVPTAADQRLAEESASRHFFATVPQPHFRRASWRLRSVFLVFGNGAYAPTERAYERFSVDQVLQDIQRLLSGQGLPDSSDQRQSWREMNRLELLASYLTSRAPLVPVESDSGRNAVAYSADDVDAYLQRLQECLRDYFTNRDITSR